MSTVDLPSGASEARNFLDEDFSQFSSRVRDAARTNRLKVEPFLRHADSANRIVRGLEVIFRIAGANLVREDAFAFDNDLANVEPPLSRASVASLLGLGAEVSSRFAAEIEELSGWAEEYGVIGEQEAGDERK